MCFEITNKVLFKHETNGTIGCHFYYDNCGFRKVEGDSLKILDQLPIKHEEIKLAYFLKRYLDAKELEDELSK